MKFDNLGSDYKSSPYQQGLSKEGFEYLSCSQPLFWSISRGYRCVNFMLKSLLSAFTHSENAPVELRRRHQTNFLEHCILKTLSIFLKKKSFQGKDNGLNSHRRILKEYCQISRNSQFVDFISSLFCCYEGVDVDKIL